MSNFIDVEVTPSACPHCGKVLDRAGAAAGGEYRPKHGDITICVSCGEWSQVEVEGDVTKLVPPSEEALTHIGLSPEARRVRDVWVRMDADRKRKQKEAADE